MRGYLGIKFSDTERFLCLVLVHRDHLDCDQLLRIYKNEGDSKLFQVCEHNRITSIAADALLKCLEPEKLSSPWIQAYQEMQEKIQSYMDELDRVSALLAENNIRLIALKNSGITRGLYPHYAACPMGDIDVLVAKTDFRKAHSVLNSSGYKLKFRSPLEEENLEKAEQGGGAEYLAKLPDGDPLWFELQWRPVAGRWIRPDQEPDTDDLLNRSVEIPGTQVLLLSPEDNLLQVSLHTAKHSYVRAPGFRLHTDVDRIVRESQIDWEQFIARVSELQVKTAVFFSLAFAHDLLDTPVPESVLKKLSPGNWKVRLLSKWIQKVGLFDPDGKKWGKVGYVFFVALLYDDLKGVLSGIFPSAAWMKQRYGENRPYMLPYLYVARLFDVLTKRTLQR